MDPPLDLNISKNRRLSDSGVHAGFDLITSDAQILDTLKTKKVPPKT